MSEYAYEHLTTPRNTSSGVADFMLLADVDLLETLRCPQAPFSSNTDSITVKQPHVFLDGEGFIKVRLAPDKNSINIATIGDKGFRKSDITLTAVIPGMYAELIAFMKQIKNRPLLVLIKDADCEEDTWYQLGCDCQSVYANPTGATGTTADGVKGWTVEFNIKKDSLLLYKPYETSGSPAVETYIDPISQLKAA